MRISERIQVQISAIQAINAGHNVLFQSQTGSGKTLAFLLPIMKELLPELGGTDPSGVIMRHRKDTKNGRLE